MNRVRKIALHGWRKALNIATFGYFPTSEPEVPADWCISQTKLHRWGISYTNLTPTLDIWFIRVEIVPPLQEWGLHTTKLHEWALSVEARECV